MGLKSKWGDAAAEWITELDPGTVFTTYDLLKHLHLCGYKEVTDKNVSAWIVRRIQTSRFSTNPQYTGLKGIQSTGHQFEYRWAPGEESYGLHERSARERENKVQRVAEAAAAKVRLEQEKADAWVESTRAKVPQTERVLVDVPPEHVVQHVYQSEVPPTAPITEYRIVGVTPEGVLIVQDEEGNIGLYQRVVIPQKPNTFIAQ